MTDLTNLPSKLVRAVWWYLISSGAVDINHCYHHFDSRERKFAFVNPDGTPGPALPIVDVMLKPLHADPVFTGDDDYVLEVQVKFNFVVQPDAASSDAQRVLFDAQVGKVRAVLMLSDNPGQDLAAARDAINQAAWGMTTLPENPTAVMQQFAKDHADMNDFSVQSLYQDVYGVATAKDVNMAVIQRFKVSVCETQVVGLPGAVAQ